MIINVCLFLCYLVLSDAAYEGAQCTKDGITGVCRNLNRCQAAIQDIRNRKNPQICSFDGSDPIVCCLDQTFAAPPVATTTRRSSPSSTTEYIPPVYDYENVGGSSECEALPTSLTSKKTGQKAFDKCIEYQEQYVYPCEKGVALTGDLSRNNHCHHNADELIIGGVEAAKWEFPHMVMLGYGDEVENVQWLCGGAIISDRFILTAGHCIASRELGPVTHVLIGALRRHDAADRSKIYRIKQVIKHPEYKPPSKYHDIALIETEKPMALNQFVVPACLQVPGDTVNDSTVLATGWGLTQYSGSSSEVLQKVKLQKFTQQECSEKYEASRLMKNGFDSQTQMCYGDKLQSKDTCQGDSGGPIQIKSKSINCMYTIIGVTSFGKGCGFIGEPGIYTRVVNYLPWIERIVWPY